MAKTTTQQESYQVLLQKIAEQSDKVLLCVNIESDSLTVKELFQQQILILPHAQHILPIDRNNVAVVVPTVLQASCIEQMLDHFYQQHLVQQTDMVLTFGWAHGPYSSTNALIEAVAQDFLERQQSQGIVSRRQPSVLKLETGRLELQRRSHTLKTRLDTHAEMLKMHYGRDEQLLRTETQRLTAVVDHDLGSGYIALKGEIQQALSYSSDLPDKAKDILDWLNREVVVCNAWRHTIGELGTGRVVKQELFDIALWFGEYLNLLHKQLELPFRLDVSLPEQLQVSADTTVLLTACIHILLAAQAAQAHIVRVKLAQGMSNGNVSLVFEDDGTYPPRQAVLRPELTLPQKMAFPWVYRSLALVPTMLQSCGVSLYCQQSQGIVHIVWTFPRPHTDNEEVVAITTFQELEQQVAELEQQVAQLDALEVTDEMDRPVEMPVTITEQVQQFLVPYVEELEQHLQQIIQQTEWLAKLAETDKARFQRIRNISLYNNLLVCNLSLTLDGKSAPLQRIQVNEQVHLVLELLQHKLSHLKIELELQPDLPPISLAPIEFKQVLLNLFKNAAEATGKSGFLYVTTTQQQDSVIVCIRDTGIGIPTHVSDRIFDLNFSTKGRGTNSGIGLHAVQSIVKRAGGKIGVTSATRDENGNLVQWAHGIKFTGHWDQPGTIFQIAFPAVGEMT